jgi:hypothetical protein
MNFRKGGVSARGGHSQLYYLRIPPRSWRTPMVHHRLTGEINHAIIHGRHHRSRKLLLIAGVHSAAEPGHTIYPRFLRHMDPPILSWFRTTSIGAGPGGEQVAHRRRTAGRQGNNREFLGDYSNPILKPQAAEVVRQHGEISLTGVAYPTPSNTCWPAGVPYIFWNGIQLLQQPHQITILYFYDHEVRHVRMNQPHPAHVAPSWYGDSVGHYEGETLVIDTVGIKADRPFAMVDMFGTPYTEALHVVERYRLIDYEAAKEGWERDAKENIQLPSGDDWPAADPDYKGKELQLEFKVEDEGVFAMPWSATITYRRALGHWLEIVCAENTREYYASKDAPVPTANKPDF